MKEENQAWLAEACRKGFGTMNKNDYEVATFHAMLQDELARLSDYAISVRLRIPESKVRRLRYEAALRYGDSNSNEKSYKDKFTELLLRGKFRVTDSNRIQFAISDKLFRLYLNDMLMHDGRFADTSFNPNIVSLPYKDLEYLLIQFGENTQERIDKIKETVKETNVDLPKTMTECIKEVGAGLVKNAAKKVAGEKLADFVDLLFNKAETAIKDQLNKGNN
ncbi:MAG: hypothetical protein J6M53_04375 [Bacteroidaceae bacterium]|nr:hypothetical protein [Bacteroidaceae bacterium]